MEEREQLEQAISDLETRRAILGDAVVDIAIAAIRQRLGGDSGTLKVAPQRKQVTVLFADVMGFTAMSEKMDHEEVGNVINSLWTRVDGAILRHGGRIDKHIGDAVMALFGAPTAREDDPERAVRAGLEVQSEIEAWKQEFVDSGSHLRSEVLGLRLRLGINTGPALIGTVGTTAEYTAIGDTVNLANRVESAAAPGSILISHNTYSHVPGIFDVTALEPIQVKGKSEPVQVYLVKGIKPRAMRVMKRGVEGIRTRTIGREQELETLHSATRTALETPKTLLLNIVAEGGIGKSRLVYEFSHWLEEGSSPVRMMHGRATADMAKVPASLIKDILSTTFEIQDSDRAAIAREKLEQGVYGWLSRNGEDRIAAHFIGQLIGFDYSNSPYLAGILGDARQIRDLAYHHLAELFARGAKDRPLVLMLEDVQWADSVSLDFFDYLLRTEANLPFLILCSTRVTLLENRPEWGVPSDQRLLLRLKPLSPEKCRRLVEEILQKLPDVPASLVDLIVEKAEGSPFYIEELINVLIEGGIILTDEPEWRLELGRLRTLKVPSTLTGVLQARLDTLNGVDREKLQQASVVGRIFWPHVLERMQNPDGETRPQPQLAIGTSLDTLKRKELIFQNPTSAFANAPEYLFKNAVLHDVTYESVLLRLRRVYHIQVAQGLTRLGGDRVEEYAGRIGDHYEQAGDLLQAAEWYVHAGKQAQATYAVEAAASYFEKALNFYRGNPNEDNTPRELEVCQRLGDVQVWRARYPEAILNYRSMQELAERLGDVSAQVRALNSLAITLASQGDHRGSMDHAVRAERLAGRTHEGTQLAKALVSQGLAHYRLGAAEAGLPLCERALAIHSKVGSNTDRHEMVRCLNALGALHYSVGEYPEAERRMEQALALSQELGDRRQGMDLLNNLGVIADARGDYELAYSRYHSALELARELGYRDGEIVFLTNRGSEQVALSHYPAAEQDLRQAIELAGSAGSYILPNTYYYLSEATLRLGKTEAALEAARSSLALGKADGAPEYIGVAYRALGMVSEELGAPISIPSEDEEAPEDRDADRFFAESLRILEEAKMDSEVARTLREWAKYELRRGHRENGTKMWRRARDIFGQLGAQMEVDRMAQLPSP